MNKNYVTINPDGETNYFETKEAAVSALKEEAIDWLYDECNFDDDDFQVLRVICKAKLIPFGDYTESEKDLVSVKIVDLKETPNV